MVSGSDEHGAPIEVEALKRKIKPRQLTNKYHRVFIKSLRQFNIRFDNYTRTESPVHKQFVKEFYLRLEKNGYVYTENIVLPYCESDKRFLPDRFVEGECPHCHFIPARGDQCDNCGRVLDPKDLINPYCVLDHATPVLRESKTWFFDLPKLADKLSTYIQDNANLPDNARNFSLSWLNDGLKPRSITRDLKWGIRAPFKGSENKTIYVWMEAVLGYVSATKEYSKKTGKPNLWKKYWLNPASHNVHFIGKDNIPFHTIVFPGLLLATEQSYALPWQVSSTEYVQFDGQRFSKSRKIGIWIDEALQLEGAEYWRYALVSLRPEQKDTNFTWEEFERKINTELNDVIGNFVHRTITFIIARFDGRIPQFTIDEEQDEIVRLLAESARLIDESFQRFRLKEALEHVIRLAREGNRFLNDREPWKQIKTDKSAAARTMGVAVEIVASIAIQLQPFLPEASEKIFVSLSLGKKMELRNAARVNLKAGQRIRPVKPLFHKVSASDLRDRLEQLRGTISIETAA